MTTRVVRRRRAPHPSWRADWPAGGVVLGYTRSGKAIYIPPELRALGVHVVGLPGQGKSRAAEAMLRQDVLELDGQPRGAVLLDPHGTLFMSILSWYATHGLDRVRRIRILDPSDPARVFHCNPLRRRLGVDPAVIAAAVTNAVVRLWGGDATATPQLRTTLKHTFFTLCEMGLPLTEAANLLDLTDASGLRARAAFEVSNSVVRQFWRELDALRMAEREARVGSAKRRLTEFLLPARVRAIFGEPDRALDWRQVMDDGEIVIVNLAFDSGALSEDEAQVIGTVMLAEIFLACQGRPQGALPFYIYLDECYRFLTEDIAKVITEGRKFGVHAVLMHQVLAQLREAGDFVFGAVMACRTKIVFGGLEPDDAEHMARSVFRGQFDLQRDKQKFRKPVVVGQELDWLLAESDSEGTAHADGRNWSQSESLAESRSTSRSTSRTLSQSDTTSQSRTRSHSTTRSTAATRSITDTDQWSHSDSRSSGSAQSDTRSYSNTQSVGLSQDFVAWIDHPRRYRWRWPEPGAIINDTEAIGEGRATGSTRSSGTGSTDTTGGSRSTSEATTSGTADAIGDAQTRGTAHTRGVADTIGEAFTEGTTHAKASSYGGSTTDTISEQQTRGRSQSLRSVYEVLPGQAYSLEELLHLASVRIANLPPGEAIVKIGRRPSVHIKVLRVADGWARPAHIARVTATLAQGTPYMTTLSPPTPALPASATVVRLHAEPEKRAPVPKPVDDEWG